jgi:hypothetical protein
MFIIIKCIKDRVPRFKFKTISAVKFVQNMNLFVEYETQFNNLIRFIVNDRNSLNHKIILFKVLLGKK